MSDLELSLVMDSTIAVLIALRIHYATLYESGTFMRLALFCGFLWLVFADIDGLTTAFDVITDPPGSFHRTGVFKVLLSVGALIDLIRAWIHANDKGPVMRAVERENKGGQDGN